MRRTNWTLWTVRFRVSLILPLLFYLLQLHSMKSIDDDSTICEEQIGICERFDSCLTDSTSPILSAWIRGNNIVISWILNSVSKDISAIIIFSEFTPDIWNDFRDQFQQCNGPRIFQLRRVITSLTKNQDSVSPYFTRLKTLWEELGNYKPRFTCGKCSWGGVKDIESYFDNE